MCEQEPIISYGTEERKSQGASGRGTLVGTWEMEKEGAKTRTTNPARTDKHTTLGSLNLPFLLFSCRTESHPLRPDNHRQHPNAVCGSHIQGVLWVLLL